MNDKAPDNIVAYFEELSRYMHKIGYKDYQFERIHALEQEVMLLEEENRDLQERLEHAYEELDWAEVVDDD